MSVASATPGNDRIVKATGAGKIAAGWLDLSAYPTLADDQTFSGIVEFSNAAGVNISAGGLTAVGAILSSAPTAGVGYSTGAGGAVTQATSRTTGVTLDKVCGSIELVSAAGSALYQSFTVTNSTVAATDIIQVCQKSGADKHIIAVTAVAAGSFEITFATTGGLTVEQPVFNFAVIKAVDA